MDKAEYYEKEGFKRIICINDFTFDTKGVNIEHGCQFTKYYKIPKGTKATVFEEKKRIMVRLDIPLIAVNESIAPYKSQLHRIFYKNLSELSTNWIIYRN